MEREFVFEIGKITTDGFKEWGKEYRDLDAKVEVLNHVVVTTYVIIRANSEEEAKEKLRKVVDRLKEEDTHVYIPIDPDKIP